MGAAQLWGIRGLPKSDAFWFPSSALLPAANGVCPNPAPTLLEAQQFHVHCLWWDQDYHCVIAAGALELQIPA